uniref:Uncharacterized protein n=1 Tax=Anopheles atroparvus TaxID=41427 RepID=A0A182J6V4_ANOAO
MNGLIKFLPIVVLLLVGQSASAPQGDISAEYPNGAFNDPVPNNENNQKFQEYASFLTRFDEWVTGKKVPIPADPVTDSLHQDLPPDAPNFSSGPARVARAPAPFDDPVPYIGELTHHDSAISVHDTAADGHAIFKREETTDQALISKEKDFGEHIEDKVPEATVSDPAYGDFIKELKRFDPYLVGHSVEIPHNATADQIWNSGAAKQ